MMVQQPAVFAGDAFLAAFLAVVFLAAPFAAAFFAFAMDAPPDFHTNKLRCGSKTSHAKSAIARRIQFNKKYKCCLNATLGRLPNWQGLAHVTVSRSRCET